MTLVLSALAYFSLMMTFVTFWVKRTIWLWGSFLLIAILLALYVKILAPAALLPIAALGLCHFLLHHHVKSRARIALVLVAIVLSIALAMHFFPGFHNWEIAHQLILGQGALPYNFWINFDKPFVGIFLLAWALPLLKTKEEAKKVAKISIPLALAGIFLILGLSLYFGVVRFDLKFLPLFLLFPFVNLFLVVIPEEAFFRGFVQEEIYQSLLKCWPKLSGVGAVFLTALFFTLMHIFWVNSLPFLTLVFVAGCIYGAIYQYTKAIESSILCHFLVNIIHLVFFTYPALGK
ncbi:MAG: CPBP family intramembrane glutamic endopeptidase [Chlamydiales bacterium]